MTADNNDEPVPYAVLMARAEQTHPIGTHIDSIKYEPRATGVVFLGDGNGGSYMSEAEKRQAEAEARKNLFRR